MECHYIKLGRWIPEALDAPTGGWDLFVRIGALATAIQGQGLQSRSGTTSGYFRIVSSSDQ